MTAYHHVNPYDIFDRKSGEKVGRIYADQNARADRRLQRIVRSDKSVYCWKADPDTFLADAEAVLGDTRPISPQALRGIAIMQDPRGIVETIAAGFRAQREPCLHEIAKGFSGCGDDDV